MSAPQVINTCSARFPKSSRLLKSKDFKFNKYKKIRTDFFHVLVEENGSGRLGVSISKKVLKRAVWRNRVRRLIKEAFRNKQSELVSSNLHFIAQPKLFNNWDKLAIEEIDQILEKARK